MARLLKIYALTALAIFLTLSYHLYSTSSVIGRPVARPHGKASISISKENESDLTYSPTFLPGTIKRPGESYSKVLVVPRTTSENTYWIEHGSPTGFDYKIYVVDDPSAQYHPPKNKGNEVMVYLTYIIDHYDDGLADVNIFMHSHQRAWHNNELMNMDAKEMINRLSSERVWRDGYMNLKCSWKPGCPSWIHTANTDDNANKQEENIIARSWPELFPLDPMPDVLSQPCCSQFAVSSDRIRALPKARYVYFRDWLLRTRLTDYISGRIWEYLWQYIFTGEPEVCPEEHICYCDGYGICFGGKKEYDHYWERIYDRQHIAMELSKWKQKEDDLIRIRLGVTDKVDESQTLDIPEFGKDEEYKSQLQELDEWLALQLEAAIDRGNDAQQRAIEVGRNWTLGDGF